MTNLGSIAVIIKPCLMCGKKVELDESFDIVFCSVKCWGWFETLSNELNALYGWNDDGKRKTES
jgi:hypothetical protein